MSKRSIPKLISRRRFIKIGGTGAVAMLAVACAPAAPTAAPAAPTAASAAPKPTTAPAASGAGKPGGQIRYAMNNEPDSLDPAKTAQASAFNVMMNLYDTLIWQDPVDLKYKAGLAESWESSPDGLTHTFKLRKGVKFHDGTPLNAEAVKANFDRIVDPATKSPQAASKLAAYQSTTVVDELTAKITLKTQFAAFYDALSQTWLAIASPTAQKKFGDDYGRNPVGTGPYMFKEWVAKDRIVVVKNPDYNWGPPFWNHAGPAYLDQITFVGISENGARLTAFESGEIQVMETVPEGDFDRLKKSGKYQMVVARTPGSPMTIFMNTEKTPFNDINVRKAIMHGLNRTELINAAFFGLYTPARPRAHGPSCRASSARSTRFSRPTWPRSTPAGTTGRPPRTSPLPMRSAPRRCAPAPIAISPAIPRWHMGWSRARTGPGSRSCWGPIRSPRPPTSCIRSQGSNAMA